MKENHNLLITNKSFENVKFISGRYNGSSMLLGNNLLHLY